MTTQRRTGVAVSGLALLGLALIAGGCGSVFETNQQACERLFDYLLACALEGGPVPPGADELSSQACAAIPEDPQCDFSAVTNCVIRNTTCAAISLGALPPAACMDLGSACVVGAP